MKYQYKKIYRLNILVLAIIVSILDCVSGQERNESFTLLFNGKNLEGWVNVNGAPETYTVRDNRIVITGIPHGMLRTEKQYQNYILELEWKHTKEKGNAGLFIHSDDLPPVGKPFTRAIEIQIMDGNSGDIFPIQGAQMTSWKLHPWGRSIASENRMKPYGQWNHYKVVSIDGTITLSVNGKEVNRGYNSNPRKGYICLEAEGSEVHFRNIRIQELPGDSPHQNVVAEPGKGYKQLYNGNDLREWKVNPGSEGHWVPQGWILSYDGKSETEGPNAKDLWTKKEFRNFHLIIDWRQPAKTAIKEHPVILPNGSYAMSNDGEQITVPVNDAGDSGIYLRGSTKSQINIWNWPIGSGEIYGYRTDSEMPPSVRRNSTPIQFADNPPGQWNRFEITVIDDWVTCILNGKLVIEEAKLPDIPKKGPIGLQHHGDSIQFANIYIKELP